MAQWFVERSVGSVNDEMIEKKTPLHIASGKGHLDIVQWLTAIGADVHAVTDRLCTPLFMAACKGHLDVVQWLACQGADVNAAASDGATPFYIACQEGYLNVAKWLAENKAEVNVVGTEDQTPIEAAIRWGQASVVRWLAENGADVNCPDDDGSTAVYYAVESNFPDLVQVLAECGADINQAGIQEYTPLILAAYGGHFEMVDCLISNGADVCAVALGEDALCAAVSSREGRSHKVIARLILAGALSPLHHTSESPKLSPLQHAFDPSYFRLLIAAGVEPTKDDLIEISKNRNKRGCRWLMPMLLKNPSLIEVLEDEELRALCTETKVIEKAEQQMKESEREWQRLVWQFCHERVTELAMVFVDLPTWIVAEICFAEQKYLRQVPLYSVIGRIENVKKVRTDSQ